MDITTKRQAFVPIFFPLMMARVQRATAIMKAYESCIVDIEKNQIEITV